MTNDDLEQQKEEKLINGTRMILSIKAKRALIRYSLYGIFLLSGEILFYTITRVGRSLPYPIKILFEYAWKVDTNLKLDQVWTSPVGALFGQASLWMFFVYASVCFFLGLLSEQMIPMVDAISRVEFKRSRDFK